MATFARTLLLASLMLLSLGACDDPPATPDCRVGADCASGACQSDGHCAPVTAADAGSDGGADAGPVEPQGDAGSQDAGPDGGPASDGGPTGLCRPNFDGTITRDEVPLSEGLSAGFKVSLDAGFDTAGTLGADGGKVWDMAGSFSGDFQVQSSTLPVLGTWYAAHFPDAGYATKLTEKSDLLGVFEITPTALRLRGVVAPDGGTCATLLVYDPPVEVLQFPLQKGKSWTQESSLSGQMPSSFGCTQVGPGLMEVHTDESYSFEVDAEGLLKTPYADLPVQRVRSTLERTVTAGFLVTNTTVRGFGFVSECFGTVGSVSSKDNETNVEFTQPAELRRLSP